MHCRRANLGWQKMIFPDSCSTSEFILNVILMNDFYVRDAAWNLRTSCNVKIGLLLGYGSFFIPFKLYMFCLITDINDCTPTSCNNRGSCIDRIQGFECKCFPPYKGDRCETDPTIPQGMVLFIVLLYAIFLFLANNEFR